MTAALVAFAVVFVAELGDKTQLVVLTLGPRHRAAPTFGALAVAIAALQGISVLAGAAVGDAIPDRAVSVLAGLLFCAFAVWTWRGAARRPADDDIGRGRGAWSVALAFFLAELGDKTMITTASLAADRGAGAVYVGSLGAMLASAALALAAGTALRRRVAPAALARAGAAAFAAVGIATLAPAVS